jgi:hypothetical protein
MPRPRAACRSTTRSAASGAGSAKPTLGQMCLFCDTDQATNSFRLHARAYRTQVYAHLATCKSRAGTALAVAPVFTGSEDMRQLIAIMATAATLMAAAPSDGNDIRLIRGQGYPACVAIVAALRKMPPSTDIVGWPEYLPPIRGIARPNWKALNPVEHMDAIRAFLVQHERWLHADYDRSDDDIWTQIGQSVVSDVQSGRIKVEETTVTSANLGLPSQAPGERPWTTDIQFFRIGRLAQSLGTIGSPHYRESDRMFMDWAYTAVSFSLFPKIHNEPVDNGQGSLALILIAGQPWFVRSGGVLEIPYTNDLSIREPDFERGISLDPRCYIDFLGK